MGEFSIPLSKVMYCIFCIVLCEYLFERSGLNNRSDIVLQKSKLPSNEDNQNSK